MAGGDHGRILHRIWNDPDFRELHPVDQRMYFVTISQPLLTHAGIVPLTWKRWSTFSKHTSVADIETAVKTLAACPGRFVIVDDDYEELFVRSHLRNAKVLGNPLVTVNACNSFEAIASPDLRRDWLIELHRLRADQPDAKAWTDPKSAPMLRYLLSLPVPNRALPEALHIPSPEAPPEPPSEAPSEPPYEGGSEGGTETLFDDAELPPEEGPGKGDFLARAAKAGASSYSYGFGDAGGVDAQGDEDDDAVDDETDLGTRIPADFSVNDRMRTWAAKNLPGIKPDALDEETRDFRNHWLNKPGKDGRKRSWTRAWYTWMRNTRKFASQRDNIRSLPASNAPRAIPADEMCPRHRGKRAKYCGECRAERLAAGGDPR